MVCVLGTMLCMFCSGYLLHHCICIFFSIVYGWINGSAFEAREQDQSYQLLVGISKGRVLGERNFNFRVLPPAPGNPAPGMQ